MELPPGIDIGETPVRVGRGNDIGPEIENPHFQHRPRIEAVGIESFTEGEEAGPEEGADGTRFRGDTGQGGGMLFHQRRMQLIDLAERGIVEGFAGGQPPEIDLDAGGRPGRFAEEIFVGDLDEQPLRSAQQANEESRALIDLQVLL